MCEMFILLLFGDSLEVFEIAMGMLMGIAVTLYHI